MLRVLGLLLLFAAVSWNAAAQECRGTNGTPSSTSPPSAPTVSCAGTCTSGSCDLRTGVGTWTGYKICNCEASGQGAVPSSCCQLALRRIAPGSSRYELVLIGDCIGCDEPLASCTKLISTGDGSWTPFCESPAFGLAAVDAVSEGEVPESTPSGTTGLASRPR